MLTSINSRFINSLIAVEKPPGRNGQSPFRSRVSKGTWDDASTKYHVTSVTDRRYVDKRICGRIKYGTAARY